MTRIRPGTDAAPLDLDLIIGAKWRLEEQSQPWRLLVVYRGLHCPLCKDQLQAFSKHLQAFADAGVSVVSLSRDSRERAQKAYDDWELKDLPVAFEVGEDLADRFGLFISESIKDGEPDRFFEPALLLFKGSTLHAAWLQSLPLARPDTETLLSSIKWLQDNDYPARGTAQIREDASA